MNDQDYKQIAAILQLIAHPMRIRIMLLLSHQPSISVSTLQAQLQVEQSLLSQYLNKMKDRGILASERQGKKLYYYTINACLDELIKREFGIDFNKSKE